MDWGWAGPGWWLQTSTRLLLGKPVLNGLRFNTVGHPPSVIASSREQLRDDENLPE